MNNIKKPEPPIKAFAAFDKLKKDKKISDVHYDQIAAYIDDLRDYGEFLYERLKNDARESHRREDMARALGKYDGLKEAMSFVDRLMTRVQR